MGNGAFVAMFTVFVGAFVCILAAMNVRKRK